MSSSTCCSNRSVLHPHDIDSLQHYMMVTWLTLWTAHNLKQVVEGCLKRNSRNNLTKSPKITHIMGVMYPLWLMIAHCAYMRIQVWEDVTVYRCVSSVYNILLNKSTLKSLISIILTLVAFMCSKYICISLCISILEKGLKCYIRMNKS